MALAQLNWLYPNWDRATSDSLYPNWDRASPTPFLNTNSPYCCPLHLRLMQRRGCTKEENDHYVIGFIIRRIYAFFKSTLWKASRGTKCATLQAKGDQLCEVLYSKELEEEGLVASFERVTGATAAQYRRGGELQKANEGVGASGLQTSLARCKRKDWVDLEPIYDWWHAGSADVEINKADKRTYKRKRAYVAGAWRMLQCEHRTLLCSKNEAVSHFFESEFWLAWKKQHPTLDLSSSAVQKCICPCIKPRRGQDCICPYCIEYEEAQLAWNNNRARWHSELGEGESCGCAECSDADSPWRLASLDFSNLRKACLCPKEKHPGLELPHLTDEAPEFYRLCCCKMEGDLPSTDGHHLPACDTCGWARRLSCGKRCKVTYNDKPVSWRRYERIPTGDRRDKDKKLVRYDGTRAELLEYLEVRATNYIFYHIWLMQWTKWQKKLAIATFDAMHEIVVIIDWAAAYEMKGDMTVTCERPTSCKQLVALVLSRPGVTEVGEEREVICDYWRWWTDCKQNAKVNMLALREIACYYRYKVRWSVPRGRWNMPRGVGPVPRLKRMLVFADGSTTQQKGRKFFGRQALAPQLDAATLPAPKEPGSTGTADSWGMDVQICLEVGAPHHNSNTVDSAGKTRGVRWTTRCCTTASSRSSTS